MSNLLKGQSVTQSNPVKWGKKQ